MLFVTIMFGMYILHTSKNTGKNIAENSPKTITKIIELMKTQPWTYARYLFRTISASESLTLQIKQLPGTILMLPPGTENVRLSLDGRQEVDIPAGIFWMGAKPTDPEITERKLSLQVYLDNYWIDIKTVTNLDYGACVNAGVCHYSVSNTYPAYSHYGDPEYANYQ